MIILVFFFLELCKQRVASFLGISKQHGCVGLVEDGIVNGGVADTE